MVFIGPHRLKHGDLMDGIDDLMDRPANVFYCDPPWGQGALKYYQTINSQQNMVPSKNTDLYSFMKAMFEIAVKHTNGPVFVEYGIRWEHEVIRMGRESGLYHISTISVKYGSKHLPLHLHIFSKTQIILSHEHTSSVIGTHGLDTVRAAIAPYCTKSGIILDPACGFGNTAQVAIEFGMVFRGNEINMKRLERTAAILRAHEDTISQRTL